MKYIFFKCVFVFFLMSNNIKNKGIRYTREGIVIAITLRILMGIQELNCGVPERTEAKVALGISLSPPFMFIGFSLPLIGSFSPSCLLPSLTYLIATITGPLLCDFPPHRVCPAIYIPMRERGNPTGPVPLCTLRDASPSCGQHGCCQHGCWSVLQSVRAQSLAVPQGSRHSRVGHCRLSGDQRGCRKTLRHASYLI